MSCFIDENKSGIFCFNNCMFYICLLFFIWVITDYTELLLFLFSFTFLGKKEIVFSISLEAINIILHTKTPLKNPT